MLPAPKIDMGFLRLLLNSGLLFLGAVAFTLDENSTKDYCLRVESRLTYDIIPLHYDINMTLFDTNLSITEGECKIMIQITHPTRSIRFHGDLSQIYVLQDFNVLRDLNTKRYFFTNPEYGRMPLVHESKNLLYCNKYHTFTLFYDNEILSGFYELHLKFRNVEDKNKGNLFRTSYINEAENRMWLAVTNFQAIGARKLFPCWDDPAFRATFHISIKHHSDYMALSNMLAQEILNNAEQPNMTWTIFEKTPVIPTYHVSAILIIPISIIPMHDIRSRSTFVRSQLETHYIQFAALIINKVAEYLKSQEKCFKKFTQVKYVAIPGFLHDAVTNLGLIYYRETAIIHEREKDSFIRATEIARLIGRTVAYQCFDKTILSWWSYMWLNEGIAMLLGMDAINEAYPELRVKDYFVIQIQQESLRFDSYSVMKPLISEINNPDIDSIFSISYYIKAPVIMRMLQQILTNNVFRKGINIYLNKEVTLETTTPDVFWTAMQTVYNETHEYNEERLNIKQIMDAWTRQQQYPIVKVMQNESFVIAFVKSMSTRENNWWIPYTIATEVDPDFFLSNHSQQLKMQDSSSGNDFLIYDIANDKWIIVNVQQIGYYRVNYDAKGWQNIVRYLNSDEYFKIHVLNRAQIIDDAFYFLIKGQLDLSIFLELARYLSQEIDYVAWYPMIKAFEYMSSFFPFYESTYIKDTMIKILDILLKEIGYEKRKAPDFINSLIEESAKWACTLGSSECRKEAATKLTTFLLSNKINSLTWMKEWTLCNALMIQNSTSWEYMFLMKEIYNIYVEKPDYTMLKFLACSKHFLNIRYNIELIALNKITKDSDRIHIFHSIIARHAKNDTTLHYILGNFDRIKPRNISVTVAIVDIINHVYSKKQLNKITEFLENYLFQRIQTTDLLKDQFIHDKLYDKMKEDTMNNTQNLSILGKISSFKRKIAMRLSQIMKQVDHFHNLY